MSLMAVKGINGGICHTIHRYAKPNNKYMKDYGKNKESSHLQYCDVKNLYKWIMSQKLPVNNFKWVKDISKFDESFTESYNKDIDKRYFLEVDGQYHEKLHDLHNGLPFLPERMKIKKVEKLVADLHDKTEYVAYIRNLKQALH